jgi:two-component system, chemotaxis family, chemotaxis protein CheY
VALGLREILAQSKGFLVVDDQITIRKAMAKVVRKLGAPNVCEASSALDAQKLLSREVFDFVIIDIFLGEESGLKLLQNIRERDTYGDIPILIVTGNNGDDHVVQAVDMGATDYLIKPFLQDSLEKKIESMIRGYINPGAVTIVVRQVENLIALRKVGLAESMLEEVMEKDSYNIRARHCLAQVKISRKDYQGSLKILNQIIDENPQFYRSYRLRSDIYLMEKKTDAAISALKSELALNPRNHLRQALLAKCYYQKGRYKLAIEHLRCALIENPRSKESLYLMAHSYAKAENFNKALYYVKRIRRNYSGEHTALDLLVEYGCQLNETEKSIYFLRDERKQNPNESGPLIALFNIYSSTGQVAQAEEISSHLKTLFNNDPRACVVLADLEFKDDNFHQAAQFYAKAFKKNKTVSICKRLVICFLKAGAHRQAELAALNLFRLTGGPETLATMAEIFGAKASLKALMCYKLLMKVMPGAVGSISPRAAEARKKSLARRAVSYKKAS